MTDVPAQAVDVLTALEASVKSHSAFVSSCCDADWIDEDGRIAVRWLLSALREHRRRLRRAIRLWRTLSAADPVDGALVTATNELLDENRFFAPHIARWRSAAVGSLEIDRVSFWRHMAALAAANLHEAQKGCPTDPMSDAALQWTPVSRRTA